MCCLGKFYFDSLCNHVLIESVLSTSSHQLRGLTGDWASVVKKKLDNQYMIRDLLNYLTWCNKLLSRGMILITNVSCWYVC